MKIGDELIEVLGANAADFGPGLLGLGLLGPVLLDLLGSIGLGLLGVPASLALVPWASTSWAASFEFYMI